jgi:hypothetical protein
LSGLDARPRENFTLNAGKTRNAQPRVITEPAICGMIALFIF